MLAADEDLFDPAYLVWMLACVLALMATAGLVRHLLLPFSYRYEELHGRTRGLIVRCVILLISAVAITAGIAYMFIITKAVQSSVTTP